jgi:NADH-quinone oxidoreductase subunit N
MLLGASVGLWQTDLKRLMGYSGITTAGYLVMGLPGLSTSGFSAAAFYLAAYCFASFGIFAVISLMEREGEDGASLQAFSGLFYRQPILAVAMTILMFGLAGLPPSGGFIGKFLLAKAALGAGGLAPFTVWTLLIALMLSTGISAYVYLRVVSTMFRKPADVTSARQAVMAGGQDQPFALSNETVRYALEGILVVAVVATLYLGILPNGFINLLTTTVAR